VFIFTSIIIFDFAWNWLPATIAGMTFMNFPFLSAMSGSDSFCAYFGKTAAFYFEPESDLALIQSGGFSAQQVVYQQPGLMYQQPQTQ